MPSDDTLAKADIAILIVAYRSRDTIVRCLDALQAQTVLPRQVFLVENGSPDRERLSAADMPGWVHFIENETNLGFVGANNQLARMATTRWIALLNPDAFPAGDWVEQLVSATERFPETSLFGSTQYAADHEGILDGVGDVYHATGLAYRAGYGKPISQLPPEGEVFAPCAAAALYRRDVFEELGGFDERFFCYNEDVDFAYRARLIGHRTIQVRDATVDHLGYASSGRRSEFATYYGARNRLWVFLKNTPGWLLWVLAPVHFVITILLWLSAARFGQFKLFGRAIYDALKAWPEIMEDRRDIQRRKTVSVMNIAKAMCWNPMNLLTRAPDIRPVKRSQ